jgi:hypothetical protein
MKVKFITLLITSLLLTSCAVQKQNVTYWEVTKKFIVLYNSAPTMKQSDVMQLGTINVNTNRISIGDKFKIKYNSNTELRVRRDGEVLYQYVARDSAGDWCYISTNVTKDEDGLTFLFLGVHYLESYSGLSVYFKFYPTPGTVGKLKRHLIL